MAFKIGNLLQQVKNKVSKFALDRARKYYEPSIRRRFGEVKRDLLDELENHPVIQAIESGPGYGNYDPLGILGGYGDLFSFIGFSNSAKPTVPLINLFKRIDIQPAGSKGITLFWEIKNFPTLKEIEEATPMPWAPGFSWAVQLEKGISGLGQYLNKDRSPISRSGYGLQSKFEVRPATTSKPYKWITPFLKQWFATLETLDNTKIV